MQESMKRLSLEAVGKYLMILLLPISLFWPVGSPAVDGVLLRFVTPGLYVSDAALIILLAAFVWPSRKVAYSPVGVTLALFALAALGFVTAVTAIEPRLALFSAGRWLAAGVVFLMFRQEVAPFRHLVWLFLATLGVHVAVGLFQALAQGPAGLPGEMALSLSQAGVAIVRLEEGNWLRAYGLTIHPNVLGGFLAVGAILAAPLLHRRAGRVLWWFLLLGLFLSFSRSAWMAVGLICPVVLIWLALRYPEQRKELVIAIAGAAAVLLTSAFVWRAPLLARVQPLLPTTIVESMADGPGAGTGATTSLDARIDPVLSRLEQMDVAVSAVRAHPWRGAGAGNFSLMMVRQAEGAIPQPVHNVPLLLAAEVGVLGGVLWLALGLIGLTFLATSWRSARPWAVAAPAAWLALVVISFVDFYPWGLNVGRLLSAFVLGLAARAWTE